MATALRHDSPTGGISNGRSLPAEANRPCTPPPKVHVGLTVSPRGRKSVRSDPSSHIYSSLKPSSLSRSSSLCSLSRASFSSQVYQFRSIQLPDASTLLFDTSATSTPTAAAQALNSVAKQIGQLINKLADILAALDGEDDIGWAAAAGRDGVMEVEEAFRHSEVVVEMYISAIEVMHNREDVVNVPPETLANVAEDAETTVRGWLKVKDSLKRMKKQVEIAMEWEELWSTVFGEIGMEIDALSRLVFEMEETRHRNSTAGEADEVHRGSDIDMLETMVGEPPGYSQKKPGFRRFSLLASAVQPSPRSPTLTPPGAKEESTLLALFARMQPLRASLDFIPMRLSAFHSRAKYTFPNACEELGGRREALEVQWKKLESDAEALRRGLEEDRWILVFRNAGRQALKMCESIERSLNKLQDVFVNEGYYLESSESMRRNENYEAKKMHYGPAVERILAIIERGVKEHVTVNGEILRLQTDVKRRWSRLQSEMDNLVAAMDNVSMSNGLQLRDSISTITSTDRSVSSSALQTPGTSPASSILLTRKDKAPGPVTPEDGRTRLDSYFNDAPTAPSTARRYSSMPVEYPAPSYLPRRTPVSRSSASDFHARPKSPSSGPNPSATAILSSHRRRESVSISERPRWNASTLLRDTDIGHNIRPTPSTTSTPQPRPGTASRSVSRAMSHSAYHVTSPLSRSQATFPFNSFPLSPPIASIPETPPSTSPTLRKVASRKYLSSSYAVQAPATPSINASQVGQYGFVPNGLMLNTPTLKHRSSSSHLPTPSTNRRQSLMLQPLLGADGTNETRWGRDTPSAPKYARPHSVMGNRRHSLLPRPASRMVS